MPLYKYKTTKGGVKKEETKEFADKTALYSVVRRNEEQIISVEEVKPDKFSFSLSSLFKRIKVEDQINFARNLAVMVDAGLSISRALGIMQKQSSNKSLKNILSTMEEEIAKGQPLSDALKIHKGVFSDLFIAMVKAGEESGTLANSLRSVALQLEKSHSIVKKVKGAMIYPAIIITLMVIIGFLLMIFMVPTLTATFKGLNVPLPLPTRVLIGLSNFLISYIYFVLIFIVALVVATIVFLRTPNGKTFFDYLVLHLPIISGLTKEVNSARTTRTLYSLISSGVEIVVALGVTKEVLQNSYYKNVLDDAAKSIQGGETISSVFIKANNLYPVFVGEMASVGEETGQIAVMFKNIAEYYEDEVDNKTKNLSTIIEPLLMVVIGVGVGIFAIAMLAPTYSLVDVIGQ